MKVIKSGKYQYCPPTKISWWLLDVDQSPFLLFAQPSGPVRSVEQKIDETVAGIGKVCGLPEDEYKKIGIIINFQEEDFFREFHFEMHKKYSSMGNIIRGGEYEKMLRKIIEDTEKEGMK